MQTLWYKNAVIYCLDVETFQDSNGDGIGDLIGLTRRLDYLAGLGVTCLWLMPFYPTPNRDNGYDVMDYFNVDPRLGHLGDFVDFIAAADERGIRVIIDLVVNHTSIEHPWFQSARSSEDSPYRDFYVWKDHKPDDAEEFLVFPGYQKTTWTYDRKAKAYYFHRFYKHQAELNIANEKVRQQIRKVMAFWLKLGVSGFRVDAAPFLIELKSLDGVQVDEPYEYLSEFRDYLSWLKGDAILLAEANVAMDEVPDYFGDGNKLHMMFNFVLNQHVMLALVRGDATAIREGIYKPPRIPDTCQWANFLRNHDEFAVGRLSQSQQEEIYRAWAPKESMRIYDRGIRRRLPPMLGGDMKRLKLSHSLLMTMPGTPVLRYGEEIGMGEDLSLKERSSIRTPMQWSDSKGAGFSNADAAELIRPVVSKGPFSYQKVNVTDQQRDAESLLNVTEHMIRVRKENPAFGCGEHSLVETQDSHVIAHQSTWDGHSVVAVHNLSDQDLEVTLDLAERKNAKVTELLTDDRYDTPKRITLPIQVAGYGYRWFRLEP
ncbi:trehalose synthase [Roseiconus nitratireducens]|uniref:Trehalose synthase n=1 Tax=Roseiconus nitratireducens TaxID=2605748 RepID=A0A5M6D511_9BACT|nr:alpha-amylase family protein [Roseiconus nitratireducens]KAA5542607.1 trehalose synthase [Roseiconus nitratireducens]